MGFRFVGQPFQDDDQVGTIISAALLDRAYRHAWIATAWAKQSGLSRIAKDIESFRIRGGYIEGIVGVDEGGATKEGLRLAIQLFDTAYVFHDPGARTFHPKIYAVQNDDTAVVVVGSGNLTRGGLYTNYEGSVVADLVLDHPDERHFLEAVRAYYDRLRGLGHVCRHLDDQAIEDLISDPSVVVVSEKQANRQRQARRGRGKSRLFGGKAVQDLHGAPPPSLEPLPDEDDDTLLADVGEETPPTGDTAEGGQLTADTSTNRQPSVARIASARPALAWWKRLTTSDAHRKPPTSHQRNYVALSKAGHNIDWHTWFRDELFGRLHWSQEPMRNGGTKDVTVVLFEVFIEDRHIGQYSLVVDHAEARIAGQNNTPTYLNWSSMLPVIKAADYREWWLELARMSDDSYRLRLTRSAPSY